MTTLTVTSKGQITFKQELLKHLGVYPGQKIEAEKLPDGRIIVKAVEQRGSVSDFIACLSGKDNKTLTIDEMNEITTRGWSGK